MKKQVYTYNPEVLVSMAQDYLNAENDAHIFYQKHRPFPGALLDLKTVEDHIRYERHDKGTACTWRAFIDACKLVEADPETVMGTVKAMNRYQKRERWQVCAYLPRSYNYATNEYGDERTRRYWAKA